MADGPTKLYILVDIPASTRVEEAAQAMVDLAARLGNPVQGRFNDTLMWACPGDTPAEVSGMYRLLANTKGGK